MRMIIAKVVFLASAMVAAAVDSQMMQSDTDFRQKLVGTWIAEVGRTNQNSWSRGTVIYSSDGSFVGEARKAAGSKETLHKSGGFWQINDGVLMLITTNDTLSGYGLSVIVHEGTNYSVKQASGYTNFDMLQPGTFGTNHHKLIRIDDREMIYNLFSEPLNRTNFPELAHVQDVITNKRLGSIDGAAPFQEPKSSDWLPNTKRLDLAARGHDPVMRDAGSTLAHDVKRFYELLRDKKWRETYEMHARAFRQVNPESDYLANAMKYEKSWGLVDYEVLSLSFQKLIGSPNFDQAILICKFTELPDFADSYATVYWHKEDGVWKCLSAGPSKVEIFEGAITPVFIDWR